VGSSALRKQQYGLATLDAAYRFFQPGEPKTLTIERNRVEKLDQPSKGGEPKQRLTSEGIQSPIEGQSYEDRIEEALVVGTDEQGAGRGNSLATFATHTKNNHAD
jgi:hypothetical protein